MTPLKPIDTPSFDGAALGLNLRHLQVFSAVALTGSVTRAGESMFRVASAITRAIAELEASLDTPLFERKARGMLLNKSGHAVLARTQRIEVEFSAACSELTASESITDSNSSSNTNRTRLAPKTLWTALFNGRRLAVFVHLAEIENMPAVAKCYGITQPAISSLVRELEALSGRQLFVRSSRGMTPTRIGTALAFRFKRVLAELRNIDADLAAISGLIQGNVIVGALPLGRTLILPSAIAALITRHPGLKISTVESPYEMLASALRSGGIDFILGALRPDEETKDLVQESLFDDCISLIARAGHPLAKQAHLDIDSLQRAQWVLSRPGSPSRDLLMKAFKSFNLAPHLSRIQPMPPVPPISHIPPVPTVETGDLAILRGLLIQSDMITAISAHQLHYEIANGELVVLDFPLLMTQRRIGLAQRRGALPSAGVRALMDEIRKRVPG